MLHGETKGFMRAVQSKDSRFLSVAFLVFSKSDLQPLVTSLVKSVNVLYVGRERRSYKVCLQVPGMPKSPESAIRRFCMLIQKLPRPARKLWDGAKMRMLDIGIDSTPEGTYWFEISAETVAEVAKLNAIIAVTAYGKL